MFGNMSDSQIAAFILGIIFTVLSIVSAFIIHKYSKTSKLGKSIGFSLTAPFIAFTSWLFLIFSYLDGFRNDELVNLLVSIVIAAIICGMLVIVARALYNKHQEMFDAEDKEELEENAEDATEPTEENQDEKDIDANKAITAPLLIESSQKAKNENDAVEDAQVEENELEEAEEIEDEEVNSESEDDNSAESEEPAENEVEEVNLDETNDDENGIVSDANENADHTDVEIEEEPTEQEDDSKEEVSEELEDETEEETSEQEEENRPLTPEEEDDAEFEKFLEALRQKAELEKNDKKTDDEE